MFTTPPPTDHYYCDHCAHVATTEVTWRETAEPTEPEPFVTHSVLVCTDCVPVARASAVRDGDTNPTITAYALDDAA